MEKNTYDVTIIGSGPVGLAAAVHAKQNNLNIIVLEKKRPLETLLNFPTYMKFFTTADKLEIGDHPFPSTLDKPTRQQALEYYQGIIKNEKIPVKQYHEVTEITGKENKFVVKGLKKEKKKSVPFSINTKYVIVATGYFDNPKGLGGIPGETLNHVKNKYDDPHLYFYQDVVIIGGGNSGIEAALELYRIGAKVTILHNKPTLPKTLKYWLKPDVENRIKEGKIKAYMPVKVKRITQEFIEFEYKNNTKQIYADTIFVLTGYVPNIKQLNNWQIETDPETLKVKLTTKFETNRDGIFVIGSAGFGKKTNAVFIENGREHAVIAINEIINRLRDPNYKPEKISLDFTPPDTNT